MQHSGLHLQYCQNAYVHYGSQCAITLWCCSADEVFAMDMHTHADDEAIKDDLQEGNIIALDRIVCGTVM